MKHTPNVFGSGWECLRVFACVFPPIKNLGRVLVGAPIKNFGRILVEGYLEEMNLRSRSYRERIRVGLRKSAWRCVRICRVILHLNGAHISALFNVDLCAWVRLAFR